jgi:hypothetical protein
LRVGNWLLSCLKCPAEQKVYLVNEWITFITLIIHRDKNFWGIIRLILFSMTQCSRVIILSIAIFTKELRNKSDTHQVCVITALRESQVWKLRVKHWTLECPVLTLLLGIISNVTLKKL